MAHSSEILSSYLQSEIERGSFPGAQYIIGEDQQVVAEDALGCALIEPESVPVTLDTIYDMASLTKPLVTALLVTSCAERGILDLKAPLARYLCEFAGDNSREITLIQLLTHTSGLPNWRPLYLEAQTPSEVPAVIARILLEPPSSREERGVIYSDLNYILLGFVLERMTGEGLDQLAKREIFNPLGLKRTMFNPPAELRPEIAATEHGQTFELANAVADVTGRRRLMGLDTPVRFAADDHDAWLLDLSVADQSDVLSSSSSRYHWRKNLIWGEVHDGNAHFLGGVAGHSGLFSTAREAFRLANQFLPGAELLNPESLDLFRENLTPGYATSRSLAWILAKTPDCSAGPALPPTAFGHNGFTGTSIWMDPHKRRVFVLLTNRVHPRVEAIDMKGMRQRFNKLAVEAVSGF